MVGWWTSVMICTVNGLECQWMCFFCLISHSLEPPRSHGSLCMTPNVKVLKQEREIFFMLILTVYPWVHSSSVTYLASANYLAAHSA